MTPMTEKQQDVYNFIVGYIRKNCYPPTREEIGNHFGMGASGAQYFVKVIQGKGHISKIHRGCRTIRIL